MDIFDTIRTRRSVRKYSGLPLTAEQADDILAALRSAFSPFGGRAEMQLLKTDEDSTFKPSTYGVISGAKAFLTLAVADDRASYISGAYIMESVVLAATKMGLGTCWLGGTFKGKTFNGAADDPQMKLVAVVPVGEPASSSGLLDRLMRKVVHSNSRKPLGDLFFVNNTDTPLQPDGPYARALEMMRLAPSSRNSQPWRALIRGNKVDFYTISISSMNLLDIGIGLYHFDVAVRALDIVGTYATDEMPVSIDGWTYITTFIQA